MLFNGQAIRYYQKQNEFSNFRFSYQEIPKKKKTNKSQKNLNTKNKKQAIKWDECFNNACFVADSGSAAAPDHLGTMILRLVLT